jgi:hypothetical protein
VIQLLDRHERACGELGGRLGVPHHCVPFEGIAGSPFDAVPVLRRRHWRDVALRWPDRRVLVRADALGTVPRYFAAGGERIGAHPLLRPPPPKPLALDAEHVLCGHGAGIDDDAATAVRHALAGARRRLPRLLLEAPAALRGGGW